MYCEYYMKKVGSFVGLLSSLLVVVKKYTCFKTILIILYWFFFHSINTQLLALYLAVITLANSRNSKTDAAFIKCLLFLFIITSFFKSKEIYCNNYIFLFMKLVHHWDIKLKKKEIKIHVPFSLFKF